MLHRWNSQILLKVEYKKRIKSTYEFTNLMVIVIHKSTYEFTNLMVIVIHKSTYEFPNLMVIVIHKSSNKVYLWVS